MATKMQCIMVDQEKQVTLKNSITTTGKIQIGKVVGGRS